MSGNDYLDKEEVVIQNNGNKALPQNDIEKQVPTKKKINLNKEQVNNKWNPTSIQKKTYLSGIVMIIKNLKFLLPKFVEDYIIVIILIIILVIFLKKKWYY